MIPNKNFLKKQISGIFLVLQYAPNFRNPPFGTLDCTVSLIIEDVGDFLHPVPALVKFEDSPDNFSLFGDDGDFTVYQSVSEHLTGRCLALLKALANPPLLVLACGKAFFLGEGRQ